jgi:hypothetical protein
MIKALFSDGTMLDVRRITKIRVFFSPVLYKTEKREHDQQRLFRNREL